MKTKSHPHPMGSGFRSLRGAYAALAVLAIAVSSTVAQTQEWLPAAHRYKGVYDAGLVGNYGIQFQRVITWNEGTSDPGKNGWIITGQDENGVRVSYDYGATWTVPRLSGLFCSKMAGLYLNTDDDLFIGMGGEFGIQDFGNIPDIFGIYVGDGSLLRAKRVEITRPGGPGPAASGGGVRAFTNVNYAGNSVIRSSNFLARRPQTGGLTAAQRPIYALEQVRAADSQSFVYMALFKSTDAGASFSWVRDLAVATYASGKNGLYHILVAKNGDVVILGEAGLWLSQDQGVNFTKKHPASGNIDISSGVFYGGGASTPSGMRIGVHSATASGGVWETANIRTTVFSKPNGNAGLPANYSVWHLGASPVNSNRLAVCNEGNSPGLAAYVSTDGGKNFTVVAENVGSGDEQWRYNVRRGHAGFHFCPTDEFKCVIPTFQTMARSVDGAQTSEGDLAAYFDGLHTKGDGFDALNGDWKKILRVCQDSWVNTATDGMHWVAANGLGTGSATFKSDIAAAGGGSTGYVSGAGGIICPNNRVIAAVNCNSGGQSNIMVIAELDGAGATTSYFIATPQVKSRAAHSRRSPKDADVAFVGRWAISNLAAGDPANVVFTDHGSHEIFDCFLDGGTLVSYWANVVSGGSDSGTEIYRSTHDTGGNNQTTPWFTLAASSFGERAICADHFNTERVLYVANNAPDVIREIKRVGGQLVDGELLDGSGQPVNIRTKMLAVLQTENPGVTVPSAATRITQLLADPNKAGVFYAIAGMHGMPNWWRTVDNGLTWTNISGNAPRTLWTGVIHPMTGELMGFSSMGEHIHRSPASYPALANRDALTNQLNAYFAAAPNAPTVVASGAIASGTGTISPALPPGIATDDILLLFAETANQTVSVSNQNGGTWTQVNNSPQGTGTAASTTATRLTAFWSRYNGSQGAPTLSDSGDHQIGRMIAIRGAVTSGNPWAVTAGAVDATADISGTIPGGATTTVPNNLVVLAVAASVPDAINTTNFSGWSNANLVGLVESTDNSRDSGNGGALGIATAVKSVVGASGDTTVTLGASAVKGLMSIVIKPAIVVTNSVPQITTASLPGGTVGTAYSRALAATGGDGALVWSIDSGSLPAGLSLSGVGTISGTPTAAVPSADFRVRVADSDGVTGANDEATADLSISVIWPQVGSFTSEDIGNPSLAGSASLNAGVYTVTGGGTDIFGASDKFLFLHQPWTNDGRIIARVTSVENTNAWSKAGVMFRETTAADSKNTDLVLTPANGTQLLWRSATGGPTQYVTVSGPVAPYWLKLERHGDTFTGWQSPDGDAWFLTSATTFTMNSAARVGLAVTAHNDADLNTSTFDNVSVTAAPSWTATDIGTPGAAGSSTVDYTTDTYTIIGAGSNIYGTSDAFQFYYQTWTAGDATLIAEVQSVQNTSAYAKAGLMIRQSLANNSAHATIDVTPSQGVEMLTRTATAGATTQQPVAGTAPRFIKLVRSGNTFTAYHSPDGAVWTQVGSPVTIAMSGDVYVGLVSCSRASGTLCTSTFSSVYFK